MLAGASLVAFGATSDAGKACAFYRDLLGLPIIEETSFALVLDAYGVELRLQKVDRVVTAPYTQFGWHVASIEGSARQRAGLGITPERYDFLEQDALGIWRGPDGTPVLWFKDPDGNLLSISEMASGRNGKRDMT